jgi:hypothetical protein
MTPLSAPGTPLGAFLFDGRCRLASLIYDEERERIVDAGEAFCRRYPDDRVCHPKE